jgi:hypothetical protein
VSQKFTRRFYKEVENDKGQKIYLFKDYLDGKPLCIAAYRDRKGNQFIIESGAHGDFKKSEAQLAKYFYRKKMRDVS